MPNKTESQIDHEAHQKAVLEHEEIFMISGWQHFIIGLLGKYHPGESVWVWAPSRIDTSDNHVDKTSPHNFITGIWYWHLPSIIHLQKGVHGDPRGLPLVVVHYLSLHPGEWKIEIAGHIIDFVITDNIPEELPF